MNSYVDFALRIVCTFVVLMLVIRLQGKKQIAQFSYFNYINGVAIGSVAANTVWVRDVPLVEGLFIIACWGAITWLLAYLSLKSIRFRRLFEGVPKYMIKDGHIQEQHLKAEKITLDDLNSMLRQKNNFAVSDVELAILELNGSLSVQSKSGVQMITREDLNLEEKELGIALPLIVDGVVLQENLRANHLSISWLERQLEMQGLRVDEVLYMEVGIDGKIKMERKDSGTEQRN